jgi:hypothetical protein
LTCFDFGGAGIVNPMVAVLRDSRAGYGCSKRGRDAGC